MCKQTIRSIALLSVVLSLKAAVAAQDPGEEPSAAQPHPPFLPGLSMPVSRDGPSQGTDVTRDLKRADGLFTIFYSDASQDPNRDSERLLALIPGRLLNQDLLLATSLSQGGSF